MEIRIRKATMDDIELLIKLRLDFLTYDLGPIEETDRAVITVQLEEYYRRHLVSGEFIAIIAEDNGSAVSTAFLAVMERPGSPTFITGKSGTILNVYTYPEYRRKGLALKVVSMLIEAARQQGVSGLDLQATGDGKPLYEKLGFQETAYTAMRLKLTGGAWGV